MSVSFDAEDTVWDIQRSLNKLPDLAAKRSNETMKQIGKIVQKNLKKRLPKSLEDHANYDGSRPGVHIEDDIVIKTSNKGGWASVTLHGGRKTAFKWHMLNDGTRNANGSVHTEATHFIDLAMDDSAAEIDKLIDQIVSEVCDADTD